MLRRVASRALSCSGKSAALTTVKSTPPGRSPGRAAGVSSLRGRDLEPVQSRLVVRDGELQRGGAVRVARLLGFLGLLAGHGERLGMVFVGAGVERFQLSAGVLL